MPSTQELRRKIRSVRSTGKLTRAMQMVAASKMAKATAAATASRTYAQEAWAILGDLSGRSSASHPLFASRDVREHSRSVLAGGHSGSEGGRRAIVVLTSNRGLAGSFNSQLVRIVSQQPEGADLVTVGRKGLAYFRRFRPNQLIADFPASDSTPRAADAEPIASLLIQGFLDGTYARVDVAYNQFISTLTQKPVIEQLLPIQPESAAKADTSVRAEFVVEPDPQSVLDSLAGRIVPLRLYQMMLESSASEHSARMVAMKSATDNAKEIADDLTLTYQSVRQANITRQIIEVSAGANALSA
ncbi:ATP synthase F1 subunit gamma [Candidatus Berkelbacteria bacterium]|nr:ATP synthase F1 subunit gamma [Candidatus Berkelbacteria bacterium]